MAKIRNDFNKQLTERERIGHTDSFHDVRNCKGNREFDEDAKGGTVSIHRHRRETYKVNRKSFNENLNPLRNFIRCNVGRPWDKVFSELNKAFDRRKVVNNHIFEHLFDYVHFKDVFVHNGQVCLLEHYARGHYVDGRYVKTTDYDARYTPIKKSRVEWYVDPRDGILKINTRPSARSVKVQREKDVAKEAESLFRVVDRDHHLYFKDGIWMLYTVKDQPAAVETLVAPANMTDWDFFILSKEDRRKVGVKKMVVPTIHELSAPSYRLREASPGAGRYYATAQTAPRKLLKQFDLAGTATYDEDAVRPMSCREFSKYR